MKDFISHSTSRLGDLDFKLLFDSVCASYIVIDLNLNVIFANKSFLTLTCLTADNILGKHIFETFSSYVFESRANHQLAILEASLKKVIATQAEHVISLPEMNRSKLLSKSIRENHQWRCTTSPMLDSLGKIKFLLQRIESHSGRNLQIELREAKEKAEAASQAKTSFLAHMSHEIRTPLAAIVGFSGFLSEPNQSPSDQRNWILAIKRNSQHLSSLIDDILDLSKIEVGRLEISPLTFNIREVLEYVDAVLGFKAKEKGIEFSLSVAPSVPIKILSDPIRLRQILLNVIGNAVKFTNRGSVSVIVAGMKSHRAHNSFLEIIVKDSGVGIESNQVKKLFSPFVQAECSTSRRFGGTGLGLALSRKLANAMGGDVELVESTKGHGATFRICIELGSESDHTSREADREEKANELLALRADAFKNLKILLVEDSPDNQWIIQRMLKYSGAKIETVNNGLDGVECALTSDFDLVLMDIQMPHLDGHEATKKLRASGFRKPIIALTAHALKEDRELAFVSGFDDHITKPINRVDLLNVISHFAFKGNGVSRSLFQKNI